MFKNRSVIEIMIMVFTFVVAVTILSLGISITIIEIKNPAADTDAASTVLFNLVSGMMGALLGLLAGKADQGTAASLGNFDHGPYTEPLPHEPPEQ